MKLAGEETGFDLELRLKPVIEEIIRTEYCFPNLKLLVERIEVVVVPEADELDGNEAYRLTLTDGVHTIKGLWQAAKDILHRFAY